MYEHRRRAALLSMIFSTTGILRRLLISCDHLFNRRIDPLRGSQLPLAEGKGQSPSSLHITVSLQVLLDESDDDEASEERQKL
jgi:hypothetical protein